MPRRRIVAKRKRAPDPKYGSPVVAQFISTVMRRGKKSKAEGIVYGALDLLSEKTGTDDVLELFNQALGNVKPLLQVKSRRVGGSTYQVPVEVSSERGTSLAMRWIVQFAKGRAEKTMKERLSAELLDSYNNQGSSVKKKEDTHRMAEANKAFAHYRW
jgi:small subunit ribosomal protein S7